MVVTATTREVGKAATALSALELLRNTTPMLSDLEPLGVDLHMTVGDGTVVKLDGW